MARRVLLYACADAPYEDFAPLFAFSALRIDPRFEVEVGLEDLAAFDARHGAARRLIEARFGSDRATWRAVDWTTSDGRRMVPNTVRFVRQPERRAPLLYITDIDLIFLDPRCIAGHLRRMQERGLPYSNCVRPGTTRLTGMHFTRLDAYHPLPDVADLDLGRLNDEAVLYEIVRRRGLPLYDGPWDRPMPGIHTSPSRPVEPRQGEDGRRIPGWDVRSWTDEYRQLAADPDFQALRPLLSERVRWALGQIQAAVAVLGPSARRRRVRAVAEGA